MSNSIIAYYYQYIYLFFVLVFSVSVINRYKRRAFVSDDYILYDNSSNALLLAFCTSIFIGLRPIHKVFVDMPQYLGRYLNWSGPFTFTFDTENFIYDNLMNWLASIHFEPVLFYILISTIYFMCTYLACKRLFPNNTLAAFLVFLAAFSTFSYGTNGIKAGSAAAVFLVALSYRSNLMICALLMCASWGFHHSMILPITAFVISLVFKNPKYYFYGWGFCLLMAVFHVSAFQELFAGFADEKGRSYLDETGFDSSTFVTGFRPDFILYSAMPVVVGYIAKFKKGIQSEMYDVLLYTYMTTNAVWMLCMQAAFTNRIAYLSWLMYPIVLIYPFLQGNWGPNRYNAFAKVMAYHLSFTLFMSLIYYGGLAFLFSM